jgi:hypothetical protein
LPSIFDALCDRISADSDRIGGHIIQNVVVFAIPTKLSRNISTVHPIVSISQFYDEKFHLQKPWKDPTVVLRRYSSY